MRSAYILALAAVLAAGPATGQVITPVPGVDAAQQERPAGSDRAREALRDAERLPVRGDYYGAIEAEPDARENGRRSAHRPQQHSGVYDFGR